MGSTLTNDQMIEKALAEGRARYASKESKREREWQKYVAYVTRKICRVARRGNDNCTYVWAFDGGCRSRLERSLLGMWVRFGYDRPWYLRWAKAEWVLEIGWTR